MPAKKKAKKRANKRVKAQPETIERRFKGKVHKVVRTEAGYRYAGKDYGSLAAVAKEITGYKSISGPRFFDADAASGKRGAAK